MQDVLALDRALASQFDRLSKLSEMESKVWNEYLKDKTSIEKGEALKKIRNEREKVSKNIISRVEGMGLDYMIPRHAIMPITKTEYNLLNIKKDLGYPGSSMAESTKTRKRTNSEIIEGIQW